MAVAGASADNTAAYNRKIIVAGDPGVGKTSLVKAFLELNGTQDFARVFYNYAYCDIDVDGYKIHITIYKIPYVKEGYHRIKQKLLEKADVVVLCFAVDDMPSLLRLNGEWLDDLNGNNPTAPLIIVANKSDLRTQKPISISYRMGEMAARNMRAYRFIECSAFTKENVMEVFVAAVKARIAN